MQTHHDVSVRVSVDGNAESRLKAIGGAVRHVGAQIVSTGVTAAIRGLGAGISFLANVARTGIQWLMRLGTVAAGMAAAGLLGVAYAMTKLVTASMSMGAGRQAAEASLTNIMGSAKAASASILELRQIAKAPGINFEQALSGYMQLKSQDVSHGLATGLVKEIGNVVAMNQGGPEQLAWVMRGVSQTFGKGKFSAEELQGQIFEQAPMARKAFAAAFGPGGPEEWEKARVKAGLSIADAWSKVIAEMAKMPRAAGGAKNAWVNLTDTIKEGMTWFGKGLLGTKAGDFLDKLSERIESMLPNLEKLGAGLRAFADGLLSKLPAVSVDLQGLLARIVAIDWRGAGERAGAWLMAGFEKVKGWWGQLVAWFKGSGVGQALADTFAKVKDAIGGIDFAKTIGAVSSVFASLLSVIPALIPMVEAIGKALGQIPWASIASSIASVVKTIGDFAERNPQAFVAILGALAANAALGNPVGKAIGNKVAGYFGADDGEEEGGKGKKRKGPAGMSLIVEIMKLSAAITALSIVMGRIFGGPRPGEGGPPKPFGFGLNWGKKGDGGKAARAAAAWHADMAGLERAGQAVNPYVQQPWAPRYDMGVLSGGLASMYMGGLSGSFPVGGASIVNGMSMSGGGRPGMPSIPGMGGDAVTIRHEVSLDAATRAALGQRQRASFESNMGAFVAEAATMGGL